MTLNLLIIWKKMKKFDPGAHFINNNNGSLLFTLWKNGETSSTTSLLLICTSGK